VRQAKASVYLDHDTAPFLVAETPREVADMLSLAARARPPTQFLELTLGNSSSWNGKPLFVRASFVRAISPPHDQPEEDE
jgi:hypothetical protein